MPHSAGPAPFGCDIGNYYKLIWNHTDGLSIGTGGRRHLEQQSRKRPSEKIIVGLHEDSLSIVCESERSVCRMLRGKSMNRTLVAEMVCLALFFGMVLLSNAGYYLGRRTLRKGDTIPDVSGAIIAAMFALLGLLIAFTFSGAYSRFDARRQLIVQEANAIGTAYLRLDLLPVHAQEPLQENFRKYAISRAELYEKLTDVRAALEELARTEDLEKEIWSQVLAASNAPEYRPMRLLLLPPINEMFDIVTTRTVAIQTHPPLPIFLTLFAIALACAGLTGYRASASEYHNQFYTILLAAVIAYVFYLILDIEYPRTGLISLEKVNRILFELAETMK